MCALEINATPKSVITALGSQCITAPLTVIAHRETLHLRRGGYGSGDQSTTLALDRIKRLKEREARFGVPTAEVTFVEINARTVLRHADRIIGDDYLLRIAPKAMANLHQAEEIWRAIAIPDKDVRISSLTSSDLGMSTAEIEHIAQITLSPVSQQQMASDLAELKALTGHLIVVLPYLAIENPKGVSILRNRLAGDLAQILEPLGIEHFDPGALISIYGQNLALNNPANIKHGFSKGFVRMLAAHLSTHHLRDLCRQVSPLSQATDQPPIKTATGGA